MKQRVKLIFPQSLIKEPVIFNMAKKHNVMPNIRRARVTESIGEMVLEIVGEAAALDAAIEEMRNQGVDVEPVEGDVLE